jgi:hypothetical protein
LYYPNTYLEWIYVNYVYGNPNNDFKEYSPNYQHVLMDLTTPIACGAECRGNAECDGWDYAREEYYADDDWNACWDNPDYGCSFYAHFCMLWMAPACADPPGVIMFSPNVVYQEDHPNFGELEEPPYSWVGGHKPDEEWKSYWPDCPEWAIRVDMKQYEVAFLNDSATTAAP